MTGDLSRTELMAMAERAVRDNGGPKVAEVRFKFTCEVCGERCILAEPNTLYERGECWRCGTDQPITKGGFLLVLKLGLVDDGPTMGPVQ